MSETIVLKKGEKYRIPGLGIFSRCAVSYEGLSKYDSQQADVKYHCPKLLCGIVSDTSALPIDGSQMKSLSGNQLVPNNKSVEFRVVSADKDKLELIVNVRDAA